MNENNKMRDYRNKYRDLKNGWDLSPGEKIPLTGRKKRLIRAYELLILKEDTDDMDVLPDQRVEEKPEVHGEQGGMETEKTFPDGRERRNAEQDIRMPGEVRYREDIFQPPQDREFRPVYPEEPQQEPQQVPESRDTSDPDRFFRPPC